MSAKKFFTVNFIAPCLMAGAALTSLAVAPIAAAETFTAVSSAGASSITIPEQQGGSGCANGVCGNGGPGGGNGCTSNGTCGGGGPQGGGGCTAEGACGHGGPGGGGGCAPGVGCFQWGQ
jgi:hypothetical protein